MRDFEQEPNENFGTPNEEVPNDTPQTEPQKPNEENDSVKKENAGAYKAPETNYGYSVPSSGKPPKKGASASLLVAFCLSPSV